MKKNRILSLIFLAVIIFGSFGTYLAEQVNISDEEILQLDQDEDENTIFSNGKGESPLVKEARDRYKKGHFNVPEIAPSSVEGLPILYVAKTNISVSLRDLSDYDLGNKIQSIPENANLNIYQVLPDWVLTEYKGKIGYLQRITLNEGSIKSLDIKNTPPYGVNKPKYFARLNQNCLVYNEANENSVTFKMPVEKGAGISIVDFENGFAKVIIWRNYGYINAKYIDNLEVISPSDKPLSQDNPIAAFSSYYDHNIGSESNDSRVKNIKLTTSYMSRLINPGEVFDFNAQVGPYSKQKGYCAAPVLRNGTTESGYGGGTCQSSSTLYNALMQLPNISILHRRPHGPSSAKYLPQHQDAAVGNENLNFKFRNDYDFPIEIKADAVDGCIAIRVYKR